MNSGYDFISNSPHKFWEAYHLRDVSRMKTLQDLRGLAFDLLSKIPSNDIGQVCGPISTGGLGSVEENLRVFNETIQRLSEKYVIFDQMPFEPALRFMCEQAKQQNKTLNILEGFYLPIFESGKIKTLYFLPTWKTSSGAQWEHDQALRLGMRRVYDV